MVACWVARWRPFPARRRTWRICPGTPPNLAHLSPGCPFVPRCRDAIDACRQDPVPVVTTESGAMARCVRAAELVQA
ncbi:MAG: oligopeptide/dipeptide ABC transporter ATP-binding protein [Rhodopila sp.]